MPSKRWVAFGKALEPFLAAALEGSLPAWKAVEVGLRLLYRAPVRSADQVPPSEGQGSFDRVLNERLQLVKEDGGWAQLAREYLSELDAVKRKQESGVESAVGGDGRGAKGRAADRACRLAKLGERSRAAAAIAGAKVLEPRQEWGGEAGLAAALGAKVLPPVEGEVAGWEEAKRRVQPGIFARLAQSGFGVKEEHFAEAARTSARGSAQSWGGWRLEHVRSLLHLRGGPKRGAQGGQGDPAWGLLVAVGMVLLVGQAPSWVYEYMRAPRIVPLEKKEGVLDPRPVGCVDVLWRWASRALMLSQKQKLARFLVPEQFAVGLRAGIEAMAHGLEAEMEGLEGACFLSGDVENAFNAVDRAWMLEAVAEVSPELAAAALAMYDGPTRYQYKGKEGVRVLSTRRGCVQGDPLSMALFCIAIRAPVKWVASAANAVVSSGELGPWAEPVPPVQVQERVQSWVEEARALAPPRDLEGSHESVSVQPRFYADDGVWRVPRWLLARMPALIELCFAVPRLAMKQEKWEAFAPEGPQGPLRQEELGPESVVRVAEGGMVVAGAPLEDVSAMPAAAVVVGRNSFARQYLAAVVRRAAVMGEAIAEMPEFAAEAYPARKIALQLVVDCLKPRFAYFTRVTRPEVVRSVAVEFDEMVSGVARRIFGWSDAEFREAAKQVSRRPVDGGVGLLPEARRCSFAYLGSWLDSAQALMSQLDVFAEADRVSGLGRKLRSVYESCARANSSKLPGSLVDFLRDAEPEAVEGKYKRRDGSVRWQALVSRGMDAAEAERWLQSAPRETKRRLAEMGGAWIFAEDVEGCVLTSRVWQVAMRLRFGLDVLPALSEDARGQRQCQMTNKAGERCCAVLDAKGHHACTCRKQNQQLARHSVIVREIGKALRRRGLWVAEERWVDELTVRTVERTADGIQVRYKEARLDLVVRDGARLWWLDFTCFHPFNGGKARGAYMPRWSLDSREKDKHVTYRVRSGGLRSVANGRVVPIVANSYAALGQEALGFFRIANSVARRQERSCSETRLEPLVQSLVVYFVASGVIDAYSAKLDRASAPSGA